MEQKKIAALLEENIKTIYAYALSRVSHKEEAEDLVGDIVMAILQSGHKIRQEEAFYGYIWAIAGNVLKKYLYKKGKMSYTELEENLPGTFELVTIFDKNFNAEFVNLFKRKLPGNILLSAYYTPMTIRELAIEMGVSTVYMEDEVALLEKYGLLKALAAGKYQTNLVIFRKIIPRSFIVS